MAYQFADGFDNYGNSYTFTAGYPWDTLAGTAVVSTADTRFAPPGTLPGGCVTLNTTTANWIRKNLSVNTNPVIMGFGFKLGTLPSSGQADICHFLDSGTVQCSL